MTEQSEIDTTWLMLRVCHYPQFVEGVVELPWADRYETLKVIYDYGNKISWEVRSKKPVEDMMAYVATKGYFKFFCAGIKVRPDGSFTFHPVLTDCLKPEGF